jgi:hypothetical protein
MNVMQLEVTAAPYLIDSCSREGQHGERTKEHVKRQRQQRHVDPEIMYGNTRWIHFECR